MADDEVIYELHIVTLERDALRIALIDAGFSMRADQIAKYATRQKEFYNEREH